MEEKTNNLNDSNSEISNVVNNLEHNGREYLTKDYVRRAKAKYYRKKKENDIEFREKEKERLRKWREEHRDELNEKARIRWQERKQKITAASNMCSTNELTDKLEKISIIDK